MSVPEGKIETEDRYCDVCKERLDMCVCNIQEEDTPEFTDEEHYDAMDKLYEV